MHAYMLIHSLASADLNFSSLITVQDPVHEIALPTIRMVILRSIDLTKKIPYSPMKSRKFFPGDSRLGGVDCVSFTTWFLPFKQMMGRK